MSQLVVRQTTNPTIIKALLAANIILFLVLAYAHFEYSESLPRLYYVCYFIHGYFFQVLRKASKSPQEGANRLEFYKDPFVLVLLMLLPAGLVFLTSTFVYSASFSVMLVAYTMALIAGIILLYSTASHRIILKEHTVVCMHGAFFRKSKVIAYEKITSIELSAVTDGISISSSDGSLRESYTWMNSLDNLYKLLQERVLQAQQTKQADRGSLTLEELADKRLSGELTDEEFSAALDARSQLPTASARDE